MSNRFPEEAKSLALSTIEQVVCVFLYWVCLFFISPSGKAHREIRDFHAVSRVLYLICFQRAG